MREYGMIYSAFWTSATAQGFSDDAKMLGAYLLTCSHGTIAGVCRLSDGYVSDDLNWSVERVVKGFGELFSKGFADRCGTTKWVWIRKFLEWNRPENPNQWKAVRKAVNQIPSQCSWLTEFIAFLRKRDPDAPESQSNPSGTVTQTVSESHTHSESHSDPHSDTQPIPNPTQNTSAVSPPIRTAKVKKSGDEPDWWQHFRARYPNRAGDPNWRGALKAANARIDEGHCELEFIDGAERYAKFCEVAGKIGTEFVQQASTFLGPRKPFLLPWLPPAEPANAMDEIMARAGRAPTATPRFDPKVIDHDDPFRISN